MMMNGNALQLYIAVGFAVVVAGASCSSGFDYLQVDGHTVDVQHGLPISIDVPRQLEPLGETHFQEAYGGPQFNVSVAAFADDSVLVAVHAEEHTNGSGGLDYTDLATDSLAGIKLLFAMGPFALRLLPLKLCLMGLLIATACNPQTVVTPERMTTGGFRNGQAAWSPDASQIAFVSNRSGSWQIWIMDSDGDNERQVTSSADPVGWPSWSTDADRVYFYSGLGESYQLKTVRVDESDSETVLDLPHSNFRPSESPDGEQLLFDRSGVAESPNHDLYVRDLRSGAERQLTSDPGYDSDGRWSPSGNRILFHSDRAGASPYDMQIYLVNVDGTGLTQITSGPEKHLYPSWCADGDWIAYVEERTDESESKRSIWARRLSTGETRALVASPGNHEGPTWSPDGSTLLVVTDVFGEGQELATINTPFCRRN